jgi:hypothetical protein
MSEFITFYKEYPKRPVLNGQIDYELVADGVIRKSSIDFLVLSKTYQDYFFTSIDNEPFYIKKTDIEEEIDPRHKQLHGKDYYNFIIDEANEFLNKEEQGKRLRLQDQDYVWVNVDTLKECIDLLSTDGKGTKQQVKEKLEELIKDAKD